MSKQDDALAEEIRRETPAVEPINPVFKARLRQQLSTQTVKQQSVLTTPVRWASAAALVAVAVLAAAIFAGSRPQEIVWTGDSTSEAAIVETTVQIIESEQPAINAQADPNVPVMLRVVDYAEAVMPYLVEQDGAAFWLIVQPTQILAFSHTAPDQPDCPVTWLPDEARFYAACSADYWHLDGQLDVEKSPKKERYRALDNFYVEQSGDDLAVYIGRKIESETAVVHNNTNASDETVAVRAVIAEFATMQRAQFANASGWLLVETDEYVPQREQTNAVQNRLYPQDTMRNENWYYLDSELPYQTGIHMILTDNRQPTQIVAFQRSQAFNVTLNELFDGVTRSMETALPTLAAQLEIAQSPEQLTGSFSQDGQLYTVLIPLGQKVLRLRFDAETGATIDRSYGMEADEGFLVEQSTTYLDVSTMPTLPDDVAAPLEMALAQMDAPDFEPSGAFTIDVAAQSPPSSAALASASQFGITLMVTSYEQHGGVFRFETLTQVDPLWELDAGAFPPQQALAYFDFGQPLIDDRGQQYASGGREAGMSEVDATTGGVFSTAKWRMAEPLSAETKTITTNLTVELNNLYRTLTIPNELENRQLGDRWALSTKYKLAYALLSIEVEWAQTNADGSVRLNLYVTDIDAPGLDIRCLNIGIKDNWQECVAFDPTVPYEVVVSAETPQPTLHLRTSIALSAPFQLSWDVEP